jgi:hypothetical protein
LGELGFDLNKPVDNRLMEPGLWRGGVEAVGNVGVEGAGRYVDDPP